jgi:hypothetical protein
MIQYAIVELEDGLTVIEIAPGETAEDAALRKASILIDPGPYASYEDATDALMNLQLEDEDDQPTA